jgi:uncharacterized protein (DUF2235 family)
MRRVKRLGDRMINKSLEQIQRQIDLQSADQKVLETVLHILLLDIIRGSSKSDAVFHAVRDEVLTTIDNMGAIKEDPQASERHKQLARLRAEQFFQVLGQATGIDADKADRSTAS